MRKLCENKGADQLPSYHLLALLFCYIAGKISSTNFKPLTIFLDCTAQFVSDLVGNPEERFSSDAALMMSYYASGSIYLVCINSAEEIRCVSDDI